MAKVEIYNHLGATLNLSLSGPEQVSLTIASHSMRRLCLYAGTYSYSGWAAGYGSDSGSEPLESGNCQCWNWYSFVNPNPICQCSNNMADYSRP